VLSTVSSLLLFLLFGATSLKLPYLLPFAACSVVEDKMLLLVCTRGEQLFVGCSQAFLGVRPTWLVFHGSWVRLMPSMLHWKRIDLLEVA
jgi:hypothetical protein